MVIFKSFFSSSLLFLCFCYYLLSYNIFFPVSSNLINFPLWVVLFTYNYCHCIVHRVHSSNCGLCVCVRVVENWGQFFSLCCCCCFLNLISCFQNLLFLIDWNIGGADRELLVNFSNCQFLFFYNALKRIKFDEIFHHFTAVKYTQFSPRFPSKSFFNKSWNSQAVTTQYRKVKERTLFARVIPHKSKLVSHTQGEADVNFRFDKFASVCMCVCVCAVSPCGLCHLCSDHQKELRRKKRKISWLFVDSAEEETFSHPHRNKKKKLIKKGKLKATHMSLRVCVERNFIFDGPDTNET